MRVGRAFEDSINAKLRYLEREIEKLEIANSQREDRDRIIESYNNLVDWICETYECIHRFSHYSEFSEGRRLGREEYRVLMEDVNEGLFPSFEAAAKTFQTVAVRVAENEDVTLTALDILSARDLRHQLFKRLAEGKPL